MMNTFKHLQYQEAREFKENTQVILISLQRAGLVCILKQGKCELIIVLFCFCFVYWLPKICFVSNKVLKSLKMCEVTHFFHPEITCTAKSHLWEHWAGKGKVGSLRYKQSLPFHFLQNSQPPGKNGRRGRGELFTI